MKTEDISPFPHHQDFQTLTLQLIESLIPLDNDLSSLLVQCLAYILRLDPQIVQTSRAMDLAFHFFLHVPEIPAVRHDLAFTLETWVLKRLWTEAFNHGMGTWGDRALEWLSQAVEMVNIASGRQKDDSLVIVFFPLLGWLCNRVGFVECVEWVYGLVGGGFAEGDSTGCVPFVGGDFTS